MKIFFRTIIISFLICLQSNGQNFFKMQSTTSSINNIVSINRNITDSCTINPFSAGVHINGLCINGTITKNSPDYVVRVILIDANDHEYAVLEAFNEINSSASTTLVNYCEETSLLGNIEPKAIKVYIKDASFQFNNK